MGLRLKKAGDDEGDLRHAGPQQDREGTMPTGPLASTTNSEVIFKEMRIIFERFADELGVARGLGSRS